MTNVLAVCTIGMMSAWRPPSLEAPITGGPHHLSDSPLYVHCVLTVCCCSYDERIDRVEARITACLRDQLGTARNANEMFTDSPLCV